MNSGSANTFKRSILVVDGSAGNSHAISMIMSMPKQETTVRFYILIYSAEADRSQPYIATVDRTISFPSQPGIASLLRRTQERLLEALRTEISPAWLTQLDETAIKGFDQPISQLTQETPAICT